MLMPNWEQVYEKKDVHGNEILAVYVHQTSSQFACYVYRTPVGTVLACQFDQFNLVKKAKEKKYRPYKCGELKCGTVLEGTHGTRAMVVAFGEYVAFLGHSQASYGYGDLLRSWTHQDGSPAGVLE